MLRGEIQYVESLCTAIKKEKKIATTEKRENSVKMSIQNRAKTLFSV